MLPPEWLLTPERAAVHRPSRTAIIADLHLGYAEARQRRGEALPAGNWSEVRLALRSLFCRAPVERLVIAGDLLEDGRCAEAVEQLTSFLKAAGVVLAGVVPGNHDRGLRSVGAAVPLFPNGVQVGDWRVVHGDAPLPPGRVVQG